MSTTVGIDDLGIYTPPFALDLTALAAARGVPPEKITVGLGAREMAVLPPWEDPVTLGAQACERLFAGGSARLDDVGMLLVATETAVDHAKPVGIFIHELLGLPSSCRTVELKHACYGGTAGLMLAAAWLGSGAARGRKALVVATDIARYDLGSSAEFTQGAGAVALVLGEAPRFLSLDPGTGVFAKNVYDFWRPLDRREALVDGKFSVDCYLEALDGAHADWTAHGAGALLGPDSSGLLYHTPFPKMAQKAHARLVAREWARAGLPAADLDAATADTFERLVDPSLGAARRMGNTYTASLYVCLASLAEARRARLPGGRVALFSYGSGCCAELFTGRFAAESATVAARLGLASMLDERRMLSVPEYEAFAHATTADHPGDGLARGVRFAGVRDDKRVYHRPEAGA
jgi:hydroxymethylglutaryl-CoA synthase